MPKVKERSTEKRTKIPLKTERVSCDDFEVDIDGEVYHPHAGEWVDILPIRRLVDLKNLMKLASFEFDADNPDQTKIMDQYGNICQYISSSVHKWNWTDNDLKPLPNPYLNADVIEALSVDEINYLVGKLSGGRTDDQKNDLPPSPDT